METLHFFGATTVACGLGLLAFGGRFFQQSPWNDVKSVLVILVGLCLLLLSSTGWLLPLVVVPCGAVLLIIHGISSHREKLRIRREEEMEAERKAYEEEIALQKAKDEREKAEIAEQKKRALDLFRSGVYNDFVRTTFSPNRISADLWLAYSENMQVSSLIHVCEIKKQAVWHPLVLEYFLGDLGLFFEKEFDDKNLEAALKIMKCFEDEVQRLNYEPLKQALNSNVTALSRVYLYMKSNLRSAKVLA